MRAYSLSPCIHISLWSGFQGVHGKENALSFYASVAVRRCREEREMRSDGALAVRPMATGSKRQNRKKERGGRPTRTALATTISSSCLVVSAVAAAAPAPQNLVSFTDYPVSNVLEKLLVDKTTGRKITMSGGSRSCATEITPTLLARKPSPILPRVEKSREAQGARTKKNAEVFTPSWLCAKMNDFLDGEVLSRVEHVERVDGRAVSPLTADWKEYVDTHILEITCGEAPFIVSRYDAATGKLIPVKERIGLLDRKLRRVNENAADENEWMKWAVRAYESVYGYEYQGDSLLLARANLLITFADNLESRWGRKATTQELTTIANRIAWNFWQMDGLTGKVGVWRTLEVQHLPGFEPPKPPEQMEFFETPKEEAKGIPLRQDKDCVIFDWRARRPVVYNEIGRAVAPRPPQVGSRVPRDRTANSTKGTKTMKFDFAIGNPPYQEETESDSTRMPPIYDRFMDEAYKIAEKVELVTPARFLFNGGYTPKAWNEKMLSDPHLKVLEYTQNSEEVFSNTDIKGGVVVTYRDTSKEYGAIGTFTVYPELNSILHKVSTGNDESLMTIVAPALSFKLSPLMKEENPRSLDRLRTSCFETLSEIFFDKRPSGRKEYVQLLGLIGNKRVYRYVRRDYLIDSRELLDKYKVLLPKSNGSGVLGEILSKPLIGEVKIGFTQSFIAIGRFSSKKEAEHCLKYIKTRFVRTLLGILKVTQDNPPEKWRYVPLQDFTSKSDINWSGTVEEIDRQLYKKYKLTKAEIKFIETHVKAME